MLLVVGYLIVGSMEYHKVDEAFDHDGQKYKAVYTCSLCALRDKCCSMGDKYCKGMSREDKVDVVYRKVKGKNFFVYQCLRYLLSIIYSLCFTFFLTFGILLSFSNIKEFVAVAIACVITYIANSVLMDFED